ncbi:MAG: tetratricopeptide repeat protein [Chloroflexota bacterium]|nr:tetratricopeptide repeat protein [Chloroflexota bacterium]MDQ5866656.1 tetratricopeptide repeat protein [Chloroflexota bacterium]
MARPYPRLSILAGLLFLMCGLLLVGCQWNDLEPRPTASATATLQETAPHTTPLGSVPSEPLVESPPSLGFDRLLVAARGKIVVDYPDAVLHSIEAWPYDYEYSPDYAPAHQILRVTFVFLRPNLDYISVDMPDDQPKAALHVDVSPVDRRDSESLDWRRSLYSDTLRHTWGLERDLRAATISPRDAISLTRQDALQRAQQIGLEYRALVPHVALVPPGEKPTTWKVVYDVQTGPDDEYADDRLPLAVYSVDIVDAGIVAREYSDAVPYPVAYAPTQTAEALAASPIPYTPEPTGTPNPLVTAQDYYDAALSYMWSDYDEAIRLLSEAIRLDPGMKEAYYDRADIYWEEAEYDLAIADYRTLLGLDPAEAAALHYNIGLLYLQRAEEQERPADYDLAIEEFDRAIETDPDYADAYFERGNAYLDKEVYDQALADYNRVLQIDTEYADAYYNRGWVFGLQREWHKAIAEYSKYLALEPDDMDAYVERGKAFYYDDQPDYAMRDFSQVIRLDGDNNYAYRLRGYAYSALHSNAEAMSDFNTALRLDPDDAYAYRGRSFLHMRGGEFDKAIEDCSAVLRFIEDDAIMYEIRGWAYLYMEQYDLSLADFDRSLELNPDESTSTVGKAWAYLELGEHDRAISEATLAVEASPCPGSGYVVRAVALAAKGEYEQAYADLDLAEDKCGEAAHIYYGWGRVYAMQGRTAEAIEAFNRTIDESDEDSYTKKRAEKELQKLKEK